MIISSALIAGGISYAAGSQINACVKKSNGTTRIISGKMKCTKSERQLSWGSAGEQGPAGATGATGSNGVSKVYTKQIATKTINYNSPDAAISAAIPAGKYNFQISAQLSYFNNNVAFDSTRYLSCNLTTHSDAPTAQTSEFESQVLWPAVGSNDVFRTSFAPATGSTDEVDMQAYSISGVLNLSSTATVYMQCLNETPGGGSAGQQAIFHFLTMTLVKTDAITSLS